MMAWAISLSTRWMPLLGKPWHTAPSWWHPPDLARYLFFWKSLSVSRTGTESLYNIFQIMKRHDKICDDMCLPFLASADWNDWAVQILSLFSFLRKLYFWISQVSSARLARNKIVESLAGTDIRLAWENLWKQLFPIHEKLMLVDYHASTTRQLVYARTPIRCILMLWVMILLLPDLDLPSCAYVLLTVLPLQQHKSLLLRYYASLPRVHLHLRQMLLVSTSVRSWSIWDSRQVRILLVTPSVDFMETLPFLSLFIHLSSSQPAFSNTGNLPWKTHIEWHIDSRPDKAELRSFKLCKGPQSWQRLTSWMGPLWQILLVNVFKVTSCCFMVFSVIPKKTFAYICYKDAWQSSFKRVTLESYRVWYGPCMIILTGYVIPSRVDLFWALPNPYLR